MTKYSPIKLFLKYALAVLIIFVIFYSVLMAHLIFAGSEDPTFYEASVQALNEADEILISKGLCASIEGCNGQEIIAVAGIPAGFSITIYGIKDLIILNDVATVFIRKFQETTNIRSVRIEAFPFSSRDYSKLHLWQTLPPWRKDLAVFTINMDRRL